MEEKINAFLAAYGKGEKEKNHSIFALLISRKPTDNTAISTVHTFWEMNKHCTMSEHTTVPFV